MFPYDPIYTGISDIQSDSLKMVAIYAEQFLRFIPRYIKNFPSHGLDHSINIIKLTNGFIENWNISVTEDEKYLLYLAAWLHDIGCICDREHHNETSFKILLQDESTCNSIKNVNTDALMQLKYVINSHSSSYDIEKVPEILNGIRLKLICSIFRLLDACEICCTKCPKAVFGLIVPTLKDDPTAYSYWDGHMKIQSVTYKAPDIIILMRDSNENSEKIVNNLKKEIDSIELTFKENGLIIPHVNVIDDSLYQ
jgi:hypothetical protein